MISNSDMESQADKSTWVGQPALLPRKTLASLVLVVTGVHALVLFGFQGQHTPAQPALQRAFITRTITLPPVAPSAGSANKSAPSSPEAPGKAPPRARPDAFSAAAPSQMSAPDIATGNFIEKEGEALTEIDTLAIKNEALEPNIAVAPDVPSAAETALLPSPRSTSYVVPGSLRLKYQINGEVKGFSYNARSELLWLHDGNSYDARLEVSAFLLGSRVQTSSGQITATGLAPKRFSDKVRSEVAAHFERDKGKVVFSANSPSVDLQAGAQDQLSIFIQIGTLVAGEPALYPRGTALEIQAVGSRDADIWRFVVNGEETLSLPAGEQTTLKLTRLPRQLYDLTVEVWLAPGLGYLPARIRLTQRNGDFVDQQLRSSEPPR